MGVCFKFVENFLIMNLMEKCMPWCRKNNELPIMGV